MSSSPAAPRVTVTRARAFTEAILLHHGLGSRFCAEVADTLIASDLLGHRTHGLARLPQYVNMLETGQMATKGEIEVIADHGSALAWQAHRLPGAWVLKQAIAEMLDRMATQPVVTATIANCSHIGCLQTYLEPIARRGYMAMLMASDPGVATVAPFGAMDPVLGPNPMAMCIPTSGEPILIDQCTSAISNSEVRIAASTGQRLRGDWVMDNAGNPTSDPEALYATPPGSVMPLGGVDLGHKGFGFGLMVEALALAMSGHGRGAPLRTAGGQGVFIQLFNPAFFAGAAAFADNIDGLTDRIAASRPIPGGAAPRLPGQRAKVIRQAQEENGIEVEPGLFSRLVAIGEEAGLDLEPVRF